VLEAPCLPSRTLSAITGCEVWLKFENLQFTASFKERGALNKLVQLTSAQRACGVLAVSAGNHAQGVAYHAERLGIAATIVMPRFASAVKVERTRGFGAAVVLHGETFDDARAHGLELARERGLVLIHPYDDPDVMAGQGTIGFEMLAQVPALEVLLVPIGGGGLISGVATAARAARPDIAIVGVQTERFPAVWSALCGAPMHSAQATIADGIAVAAPGEHTLPLIRERVDDVLLVGEDDIEQAILMLLEIEKTVVEGAGAVGLAALLKHRQRFAGRRCGLILSGGNIEPLVLAEIIERGMVRSGRLARLRLDVRDVPGALADVATLLGRLGANIEEIQHQRAFTTLSVERAQIEVVVHTRNVEHIDEVLAAMREQGYRAERVRSA
jgi:threonine dehydratase